VGDLKRIGGSPELQYRSSGVPGCAGILPALQCVAAFVLIACHGLRVLAWFAPSGCQK
jgi:hypothetical protein